jgi:hypothetical protein
MKLLITSLIIFLAFSSLVLAQSFKDKVIFSPDISFLWNFQRGVEEIYRIIKFTSTMRIQYSLELCERRIGEMEVLINKSKINFVPIPETDYEMEIDKIESEMNSTDIFSKIITIPDIKENVTERLNYDNKILNIILSNATEPAKTYVANAIKKTSNCIDSINSVR